ncbi:RrF2 family transcriptional regulator [Draconibacterium orientale]|uniref:Rrf2 family transcriptional regulator n=1 Tax=Draconibacterium orientale TaxID=1168034 RepID=A0ABM5Q6C9_9BACT|nr:Rrf2 family transcriptional regulator [Draconibacterium orientale]AHW59426.1 Rrf2 family transcriptional regulator [Draconibacterium orientale]
MKFSTKTRYGVRAILEIAQSDPEIGIYQKDISANQNISYKYLDHIINSLKVAGLVSKAGGRRSGYILTRKPEDITIYDIHNAFEPGICVVDCLSHNYTCKRKGICASRGFWGELNNQIIAYLKSTTIADLINNQAKLDDVVG